MELLFMAIMGPNQMCKGLEFVKGVIAYQKKLNCATKVPKSLKLDKELEQKRNVFIRSFSLAKKPGAEFLEVDADGSNSEECVFIHGETEVECKNREIGKSCDGEDNNRTVVLFKHVL
ncbi:putative peptidase C26, gamma-glutamyl-gamma-aminobutyrate hydrolase PuuD [Helianthus debilis subsp. tardiflorus]